MILHNFIAFEGIDGTGTSTQIAILAKRPEADALYLTAEPTKTPTGVFLRQILGGKTTVDPKTAAFLFAADRNEHIYGTGGIMEMLGRNKAVITDRYIFSNLAYQSVSCGRELPAMLNSTFPLPQMVFYFDLEPSVALARIRSRGETEIYEKQDFLEKTLANYRSIIAEYETSQPDMRIIHIDATQSIEKTAEIIWSYIGNIPILKK